MQLPILRQMTENANLSPSEELPYINVLDK